RSSSGVPSTTPTETAATESRNVRERPKRSSARIAATYAPQIAAHRVPPSAWRTSQSSQSVRSPSASKSATARIARPISRWISIVRPCCLPRVAGFAGDACSLERRDGDMLHFANRQLEEAAAELAEGLGIAGREEAVGTFAAALVLDALALERLRDLASRLLGREDELHVAAEDALEDLADQRVVRAAEDHGVDPFRLQRRRVLAHRALGLLAVRIVALDQRHEPWAGELMERDAGVERVDELGV